MNSYQLHFYNMPGSYIGKPDGSSMPRPNKDMGIRTFQVLFRGVDDANNQVELGYANVTFVDFSKANKKGADFQLSDTACCYALKFPKAKGKILFIDKMQIDHPFRDQGIGSAFFSRLLFLFQSLHGVEAIALCPYPYELNGSIHFLKKAEQGDLMEDYYSSYYLKQKEKLEKWYSEFGFVAHKTSTADIQDAMLLPLPKHSNKSEIFLKSCYEAQVEQRFYIFVTYEEAGEEQFEAYDLTACKHLL